MSDETKDVVETGSESQELPTPKISQANPQDSPGNLDEIANALMTKMEPMLMEKAQSILQSTKDKGIAEASKKASSALEATDGMREVVDKFTDYLSGLKNSPEDSVGAEDEGWAVRQNEILEIAGISPQDGRLVDMLRKETFKDHNEYIKALEAKSFEWKVADANKPQPSSSTVAQIIPSVVALDGKFDEYTSTQLGEKLVELLKAPTDNKEQIKLLDDELKLRDAKKG